MPPEGIKLSVTATKTAVLSSESLPVVATLSNTSAEPLSLAIEPLSPIVYELRSPLDGQVLFSRSSLKHLALLNAGQSAPPLEKERIEVEPGGAREWADDPPAYHRQAIPPASYHLVATCLVPEENVPAPLEPRPATVRIESAPLPIEVSAPDVAAIALLFDPYANAMASALVNAEPDGVSRIFQRDTDTVHADGGVYRLRKALDGPARGIAIAVHTAPRLHGRWLAWIENGQLGGLLGWLSAVTAAAEPVPVELETPGLVEAGFQVPLEEPGQKPAVNSAGLFLVTGLRDGETVLRVATVTDDGIALGKPLRLCQGRATRVVARCTPATSTIHVAWAESSGETTRVVAHEFRTNGRLRYPEPRVLLETTAPLAAMELEALGTTALGFVHVLLGPLGDAPEAQRLEYLRLPLHSEIIPPERFTIAAPPHPADELVICGAEAGELVIVARLGTALWRCAARGDAAWRLHRADVADVRHLALAAAPDGYWCAQWTERGIGFCYAADPGYSRVEAR
jgi:hypothetical protein